MLHSVDLEEISFRPPNELSKSWHANARTSALDFLQKWPKFKIMDFVYVDDWHAYPHVKRELELLDGLVSPKSLIVIHDTMYGNWQPHYHCDLTLKSGQWEGGGPYRAVAELDPQFWEFATIPANNGLTILRKKYSNKYHI
jgi:cephalosporin hydroxylase